MHLRFVMLVLLLSLWAHPAGAGEPFSRVESIGLGIRAEVERIEARERREQPLHLHGGNADGTPSIRQPLGRCQTWNHDPLSGNDGLSLPALIQLWARDHVAKDCFVETRNVLLEEPGNENHNHVFVLAMVACRAQPPTRGWDKQLLMIDLWHSSRSDWVKSLDSQPVTWINCLLKERKGTRYTLPSMNTSASFESRHLWIGDEDDPPVLRTPYYESDFEPVPGQELNKKIAERLRLPTWSDNEGIRAGILLNSRKKYEEARRRGAISDLKHKQHLDLCKGVPYASDAKYDFDKAGHIFRVWGKGAARRVPPVLPPVGPPPVISPVESGQ